MAFGKGLNMESLTGLKRRAPKDKATAANNENNTERIVLRKEEQQKLEVWINELNNKFDGMIRLTKSDLANFLIRQHADSLSEGEVLRLEAEHYDEVRWLNWALGKIREAKRQGLSLTLDELIAKRRSQAPVKTPAEKLARKSTPKKANKETSPDPSSREELPAALSIDRAALDAPSSSDIPHE